MQNTINRDNYEAFLLDYMEGNLNAEDALELQLFAAQNPDLNIDLNDRELVELAAEEITFENKPGLKKTDIRDELFVAYIENELNADEKQIIEGLCAKDEKLSLDLKLYKHTILAADTSILFENKTQLKKQETKVFWLFSREVLSAAASLILLMGLWLIFRNFSDTNTNTLNSRKMLGTGKINTLALKKNNSVSSYTTQETKDHINNNSQVAYSSNKIVSPPDKTEILTPKENLVASNTQTESVIEKKDVSLPNNKQEINIEKDAIKMASNNNPSTSNPYVILEKRFDEDEVLASNQKNGFWKRAMKALNGLNKLGVKKVNGTETTQDNNEQFVLSMGNFTVEKNKFNAE